MILSFLIAGCGMDGENLDPDKGSVSLNLKDEINTRTFLPGVSMEIDSFEVIGDGPGNNTFEQQNIDAVTPMISIEDITIGTWRFTVNAYNANNIKIGTGSGQTTVYSSYASGTNNLDITVRPVSGSGTARIDVRWIEAANEAEGVVLDNPSISGELRPYSGSRIWLPFNFVDESGRRVPAADALRAYASRVVSAGYYTNIVLLYEDGILAAGGVEVIRIVAGHDTLGRYDFEPDPAQGSINVNISVEMAGPLSVRISGAQTYMAATDSITLSGQVDNLGADVNVVYVWYDNGIAQSTGQSFTLDQPHPGKHRIDLTAFTADGRRAGSVTQVITVDDGVEIPEVSVDSLTNNNRPTWTWNAVTDAEGYRYRFTGEQWTETDSATTDYTPVAPLIDGDYTLEVQAKKVIDGSDVWSGIGSASTHIDTAPPAIPVITGEDKTINTRPTWSWAAVSEAVLYSYRLDNGLWEETTELSFIASDDLSYANHTFEVRAQDNAGNWSDPATFITVVY